MSLHKVVQFRVQVPPLGPELLRKRYRYTTGVAALVFLLATAVVTAMEGFIDRLVGTESFIGSNMFIGAFFGLVIAAVAWRGLWVAQDYRLWQAAAKFEYDHYAAVAREQKWLLYGAKSDGETLTVDIRTHDRNAMNRLEVPLGAIRWIEPSPEPTLRFTTATPELPTDSDMGGWLQLDGPVEITAQSITDLPPLQDDYRPTKAKVD